MAQALNNWALGIGHWAWGMGHWLFFLPLPPLLPLLPHPPHPHSPLPTPQILKTLLANYALDKLKIEIAGNSHSAFASPILWEGLRPNLGRIFSQADSLCED